MMRFRTPVTLLLTAAAIWAQGQPQAQVSKMRGDKPVGLPPVLVGVGIQQKLGSQLPLDTMFRDETGRLVPLSTYFGRKPVLLALVYYECPMLCTQILNGMEMSLKAVPFTPGQDFEVVAISFNPKDTPQLAAAKKTNYVRRYGHPETANGWHFLTGDEASIKAVTEAVGFHYKWDAANQQFAHASAIYIATPDGRMSRYFYGVEYAPKDVRLGLVDASSSKIGSVVDEVLLFCYHYDPYNAKYTPVVTHIIQFGGVVFVLIGSTFLFFMWRHDWRRDRKLPQSGIPEVKRV